MDATFIEGYIAFSVLIAVVDLVLAIESLRRNRTTGRFLGTPAWARPWSM